MAYMILRVVYTIYFAGAAAFLLKALSTAIFSTPAKRQKAVDSIPERLLFAFIWPLSLFSRAGWKKITRHLTK